MTDTRAIPRIASVGPVSLFRHGPWEMVLFVWLLGVAAAIGWLASPTARVAFVTSPPFSAAAGAALAAMVATIVFTRLWWDARHGWPFIFLASVAGGATFALAAGTVFAPALAQASVCSPGIAGPLPAHARIAGYGLPLLLLLAWTFYLLARIPVIETIDHITPGSSESRHGRYAHVVRRLLPYRLALLVFGVVVSTVTLMRTYSVPLSGATPDVLTARLAIPSYALVDRARGGPTFHRLAEVRRAAEQRATMLLENLELDQAAAAVRACSCRWVTPEDTVAPHILSAAAGFAALDEDLDSPGWRPSAATSAALLKILPISDSRLRLFDDRWVEPGTATGGALQLRERDTTYRDEVVLRTRRTYTAIAGESRLTEVAIKLLGRGTRDTAMLDELQRRIGRPPDEGPCAIGRGSFCASWHMGELRLHVNPEFSTWTTAAEINDESPLWIALSAAPQNCCRRR